MPNDPDKLSIPVDALELSVRTSGVLDELGATTLGELLALPEIAATRLSIAELEEVFDELDVTYEGVLRSTEPEVDVVEAEGSVPERWATISAWLEEHRPTALPGFAPPAADEAVKKAEAALGFALPEDYRAFLRLHNGQTSDVEPMVWTSSLLSVDEIVEKRNWFRSLPDDPDMAVVGEIDPAIRAIEFSQKWVPIGISARGRDIVCLDLDPTEQGTSGQVILVAVDSSDHELLAKSFGDFLSLYFREVQTGEIEFD